MQRARNQGDQTPSLLSVVASRRGYGVTDKRDLIYGLLAIADLPAKAIGTQCPVVDYHRSAVDVFTDAAIYMFSETSQKGLKGDLYKRRTYKSYIYKSLFYVDTLHPGMEGPPTWIPDWPSTSGYSMEHPIVDVERKYDSFSKFFTPWSKKLLQSPYAYFPKPGLCVVRLFRVGKIQWINEGYPGDSTFAKNIVRDIIGKTTAHGGVGLSAASTGGMDKYLRDHSSRDEASDLVQKLFPLLTLQFTTPPSILFGRRIATITKGAYFCLVPDKAKVDDVIYGSLGCSSDHTWSFWVLRPMLEFSGMSKLERESKDSEAPDRVTDDERHFAIVGRGLAEASAMLSWSLPKRENLRLTRNISLGHDTTLH